MRLITNLKYIIFVDSAEACCSRLKVVQSVPHIALSSEDNSFDTFWNIVELFGFHNYFQSSSHLIVC